MEPTAMEPSALETRPAGYSNLLEQFGLTAMPHWHSSYVSLKGFHRSTIQDGNIKDIYPVRYWPGERIGDHLEFALKYDGVNLGLLTVLFQLISREEITEYIKTKPTGKYSRRIWFFFEFLTGQRLPIDDLNSGNYVEALEPEKYYTIRNGRNSPRHRVVNNLLGTKDFCPIIRRTEKNLQSDSDNLRQRCEEIVIEYPPELLRRTLQYLYHKETKSSFEIENIKPTASRIEKFIALLELAEIEDFCKKEQLIKLQNRIVDPRFANSDYRTDQNYIGQSIAFQKEIIHYICPKPEDLPQLMQGLIEAHRLMKEGDVPAVVHSAAISYGFVFLHPFDDGNGRIHRFLIHNILATRGMTPRGLMFPISAVMLKDPIKYDKSLESFSQPLLQLIDYRLDEWGKLSVDNDTAHWYRFMNLTAQSEALFEFVSQTIDEELKNELSFLANYDQTKAAIQGIIDMPDRLIDLFIRLCLQNNGQLSSRKRAAHFEFLTDNELKAMEQAVRDGYML